MAYSSLSILCSFFVVVHLEEVFNTTPQPVNSNFSCLERKAGFYADIAANCRLYHTCDDQGNKFTYHCPEETAFRQEALICDHAHLVDCERGTRVGRYDNDGKTNSNVNPFHDNIKTETVINRQYNVFHKENTTRTFSRSFRIVQKPFAPLTTVKPAVINEYSAFDFKTSTLNRNGPSSTRPYFQHANTKTEFTSRLPVHPSNGFRKAETPKSTATFTQVLQSSGGRLVYQQDGNPVKIMEPEETSKQPVFNFKYRGNDDGSARSFVERQEQVARLSSHDRRKESSTTTEMSLMKDAGPSYKFQNSNYPYVETLRSMQIRTQQQISSSASTTSSTIMSDGRSTTIIDVFTATLKPLVPNELEFDPYYPKQPSTTEAYYTPSYRNKGTSKSFRSSTQRPSLGIQFEIPAVLPDFNSLEDLVDRRKLFYIPRTKFH